ncbi:hypothetical protein BGX34_001565 [Mortierella sp. NVP85]|nr:hypothetical protein BGX34_001565 [Mortierella sp. NVP85]
MPQTEHLEWLAQQEICTFTAFVINFQYTDRDQAYADYEELVSTSHLKESVRKRILEDLQSWKRNESGVEMFWLERESYMAVRKGEKVASTGLIKVATKGLPDTITQGVATAELSEPVSSRTSAAATATNGGLGSSSSITATTSAFYDPKSPFLDTSTPASGPKRTPTEAEPGGGPTKNPESHGNSKASTRSEKPVQEPEFPDPTANLEKFVALNQEVEWIVQGEDLVQKFREFRAQNLQDFSLARDGTADVTIHSKFRKSLAPNVGRAANRVDPISNLHKRWPTLKDVLERVFAKSHYDGVDRAIAKENLADPVVRYVIPSPTLPVPSPPPTSSITPPTSSITPPTSSINPVPPPPPTSSITHPASSITLLVGCFLRIMHQGKAKE